MDPGRVPGPPQENGRFYLGLSALECQHPPPQVTCILVNPRAGRGAARTLAQALAGSLPGSQILETESANGARSLAELAAREGAERIVVIGGDGTISQAVEGIVLSAAERKPALTVLPAGTGGDYARTLGINDSVTACLERLERGQTRRLDVGKLTYTDAQGEVRTRTFTNVMSFGLGGLTDRIVENGPKYLGGRAAFFLGALSATLVYRSTPVELIVDGEPLGLEDYMNVAVCVGRYFGGGMQIAPNADPADGLFDLVAIRGSKLQTISLTSNIYRGTHLRRPFVHHCRARRVEARLSREGEMLIDLDGEQPGRLPLEATVLPGAIAVIL